MSFASKYIQKNVLYDTFVSEITPNNLALTIVIPCYNEPDIKETILSLSKCELPQNKIIEILVVINSEEEANEQIIHQNETTYRELIELKKTLPSQLNLHIITIKDIRKKWAGAGFARKVGMDEAIRRWNAIENAKGIIVSLDADCKVDDNYIKAILESEQKEPKSNFWTIYFEHPFLVDEPSITEGIVNYELHMRYYRQAMLYTGYPHAIHTVGSAFAVRADAYVKQGGMNRKKAGEDFYFLHKLVALGQYGEINNTVVRPATRLSERVPFGTGPSLKGWIEGTNKLNETFAFDGFEAIKPLYDDPKKFFHADEKEVNTIVENFPEELCFFFKEQKGEQTLWMLKKNCGSESAFVKRFFIEFDAFYILQFLNTYHRNVKKQELEEATNSLFSRIQQEKSECKSKQDQLIYLRRLEKGKTK